MSDSAAAEYSIGDPRPSSVINDSNQSVLMTCGLDGFEYQLEPYLGCGHQCLYCYALCGPEGSWVKDVALYKDMPGRLSAAIEGLEPQRIYMGLYCDPYQPAEEEYSQTRWALEILAGAGFSAGILTKSDLVVRDLDLLTAMPEASVGFSLGFTDEELRQSLEETTPPNARRIDALKQAKAAGLKTSVLICPVLPFLTDLEALINSLEEAADRVWIYPLSMNNDIDPNWQNVWRVVSDRHPDLAAEFKEAVFDRDHEFWRSQRDLAKKLDQESRAEYFIRL
jgi:DNA repair photolyase